MSCGRTPTRRQVHGHKRIVITGHRHGGQIGKHKVSLPPKTGIAKGGGGSGSAVTAKPKQRVTATPKKSSRAHGKLSPAARRSLKAWEKKHPFKNDFAAWKKAHPFKNKRFSRAQFLAWEKKHPFKHGGHTPRQSLKHKMNCHVKTRHAVSATRGQRKKQHAKPKGKRIVIVRPLPRTHAKSAPAQRAQRALRAR